MFAISISASPLGLLIVFLGGVVSILSPCVLPILPGLFGVVSGTRIVDLQNEKKLLRKILKTCIIFSLGFSLVYVMIVLSATSATQFFIRTDIATRIGGFIIIIFALILLLNQFIPTTLFSMEKRPFLKEGISDSSALVAGAAFGFGWSPCLGPILAAVLAYASTEHALASRIAISLSYCVGLCLSMTFVVYASFKSQRITGFLRRNIKVFTFISCGVMLFFGVILLFDQMSWITSMFTNFLGFIGLKRLVTIG